jgi:PAS domain-containing protein
MRWICSWCGRSLIARTEGQQQDGPISHGLCDDCRRTVHFQGGVKLHEFLESLDAPVVAVDSDVMVKVANRRACEALGKKPQEIADRRGGDVFECAYARLPGGCGRTLHCSGCAIRRSVTETFATGRPKISVPAPLRHESRDGEEERINMYVSTEKVGDLVLLRIDRMEKPAG